MQTSEIRDICNLLKLIILDEEDFNLLYSVLISPIFEIKMNDLTNIKSNDFDALKKFIYKSKIGKKYDEWQKLIGKIPIHDLLDKIYSDINIFEKYNTENELKNIEIKNNFLNFLNLSLKINNGRFISPFFFLNQIEAMENYEESYEFDSLDSVKVLTIHAAKGLESKIVIFAQSYLKNNLMKDKVYPIFNTDLSCKDLFYKPEVFKNNCLIDRLFKDSKNKQLNEEENLAYVACTRAKDILIINGFASKKSTWFSNFSSSQ
jgi:ATP-dependent helicase/nuclease subunit A